LSWRRGHHFRPKGEGIIRRSTGQICAPTNAVILLSASTGAHDGHGTTATAEDTAAFAARLGVTPPLAKLTRPDLTPVWIKGAAVTGIRAPLATEQESPGAVNAVVILGALHQSVHEDLSTAERVLNAHGANV
jgi:hypothetical protein